MRVATCKALLAERDKTIAAQAALIEKLGEAIKIHGHASKTACCSTCTPALAAYEAWKKGVRP